MIHNTTIRAEYLQTCWIKIEIKNIIINSFLFEKAIKITTSQFEKYYLKYVTIKKLCCVYFIIIDFVYKLITST